MTRTKQQKYIYLNFVKLWGKTADFIFVDTVYTGQYCAASFVQYIHHHSLLLLSRLLSILLKYMAAARPSSLDNGVNRDGGYGPGTLIRPNRRHRLPEQTRYDVVLRIMDDSCQLLINNRHSDVALHNTSAKRLSLTAAAAAAAVQH